MQEDTIAAISTPLGEGGIGIVRLSGPNSFPIAKDIFTRSFSKDDNYPEPRKLYHGFIYDHNRQIIDESLVAFMPSPHTYTREDVVEINSHSGIITMRLILETVLGAGCRLAEPGEFTKRAFINGRIDLSQAEAVMNIIKARSEEAVQFAVKGLQGEVSEKINIIRDDITEARAPMEAWFDYPEEFNEEHFEKQNLENKLHVIKGKIEELLEKAERSRAYMDGVSVAIIGRPNVGKSSLLNALLKQQKAIVHEMPGTTRDMLEGSINLGGYPINLVDTAGIQGTDDPVEKEGIERAKRAAEMARLLIMVVDGSRPWSRQDEKILRLKNDQQGLVVVVNKSDLGNKVNKEGFDQSIDKSEVIMTSAIKGEGIDLLEQAVTRQLDKLFGDSDEANIMVTLRHKIILSEALKGIIEAREALYKQPPEIVSFNLQQAWQKLGEITGETVNDALLDHIFKEFCLGK
ncbi:MAG: tRNA uridine-5-carboxymethylaminomethyl(34) synthesis GTPase MnmE [Candidatus Humimicrobiaceae bacterium]